MSRHPSARAARRPAPPPAQRGSRPWILLVVIAAVLVAYHNSFLTPFVFDDEPRIVRNPLIRTLWPPWEVMAGTSRPLVQYSLAVNYAISGLAVWSYHAVNLALHALSALLLFGVIRATLAREGMPDRYRRSARPLALAATLIWAVHPLQTESVTYVIQRGEVMAGLFYLLALYALIRGAEAARPGRWQATAIAACALGMASKLVMATAPVAFLLYDRMFLSRSFAELWARRRRLHLGTFATLALVPLMLANGVLDWRTSAGFNVEGVSPIAYAITQAGVLLHYLRLCVWPAPLVLDYGWPIADRLERELVPVLAVSALLALAVVASWRGHRAGFPGLWFFLVLMPTSSLIPIADPAFEHRLYLPLAAPVLLGTLGVFEAVHAAARRFRWRPGPTRALAAVLVTVAAGTLTVATVRRNHDYRSVDAIWTDTLRKRPENPRVHVNVGLGLLARNRTAEGLAHLEEAVRIDPRSWTGHLGLGFWLTMLDRIDEALPHLREAVRLAPDHGEAHFALGAALLRVGALDEAQARLEEAARLEPDRSATHHNLGHILERKGRLDEALRAYAEAVRLRPDEAGARVSLGLALARSGRVAEGRHELETARRLRPDDAAIRRALDELERAGSGAGRAEP